MPFEVEQKFQFESEKDFLEFSRSGVAILQEQRSGVESGVVEETDVYYNHPARDFVQTDEALRIRHRVIQGNSQLRITYKGPKLDVLTKTRRELELPLVASSEQDCSELKRQWDSLLQLLGFIPVGSVYKIRRKIQFVWDGSQVELSLDRLPAINGYFAEIELIAQTESELDSARAKLLQIADSLKLVKVVKKSYLNLTLDYNNSNFESNPL
ncbi:MAG: class IV adenylate cyclase [Thermoguttaceae bacterium]|nr:class IV adenylate cyclase [Thermoguttaceae bacterium]